MSNIEKAKEIIFISMMDEINTTPRIPISKEIHVWDAAIEKLSELLIPLSGCADTLIGELLRAYQHIQYRWFNDGDSPFSGSSDIIIPDFLFIARHCKRDISEQLFGKLRSICQNKDEQMYKRFVLKGRLAEFIIDAILDANWERIFDNDKDSRSYYEVDENFDICDPDLYLKYYDSDNNGFYRDAFDEMAWWCKSHSDKWDTDVASDCHTDIDLTINEKGLEWIQNKKKEFGMI